MSTVKRYIPHFKDMKAQTLTDDIPMATLVWCKEHKQWEIIEEPMVEWVIDNEHKED